MSETSFKYIVPKLNSTAKDVVNFNNKQYLTDNFCVVGCDSAIDYDNDDKPIFGSALPLAYSYDGVTFNSINDRTLYYIILTK
jgi:hypothetical protein